MKKILISLCFLVLTVSSSAWALNVALVLDKGGKDDKSFNSAAFAGVEKAKKELGITYKYVETMDDTAVEATMRSFAAKKYDLIIGVGFSMAEAVKKVSKQYPNISFALVDAEVDHPNVRSLLFEEHQGSYLVGAVAAMKSKTGKIGFLGGMDVPLIRRFAMGFEAGVKKINPKAEILENYIGVTGEAWNNPAKAKELSLAMFSKNVDVIFAAAGASNYGLFDAAEEKRKYAIGVDSNQNWIKPGTILTSMLKRVDVAVFDAAKDLKEGKFKGGTVRFGLANQGIDYAMDEHNKSLITKEIKTKVEQLKKDILSGKIVVPDYYKRNE
ncbi:MAG: BMP family ABC transporter substrate-binding protein [Oligoflexia bacterium]|nr:BMP family ABC transporter substrate-binding protein [Oligoflexia bacterium]